MPSAQYGVFRALKASDAPSADCFVACHGYWANEGGHTDAPCTLTEYGRETHPLRISEIIDTVNGNGSALKPQGIMGGGGSTKNRYFEAFNDLQIKHVLRGWFGGTFRTGDTKCDLIMLSKNSTSTLQGLFETVTRGNAFVYNNVHLLCCRVGDDVQHGGDWGFLNDLKPAPRAAPDTSNVEQLINDALKALQV